MSRIESVLAPLGSIDPRWAMLALALQLTNLACRASAWRNVLAAAFPAERLSVWRVGCAYAIGAGLNGYLPARGGDAAKIALVRLQHPATNAVSIGASSGVLVLLDALIAAALLVLGWRTGVLPNPPSIGSLPGVVPMLAVLGVVLAVIAARRARPLLLRTLRQARRGFAVLGSPGRYARTVLPLQLAAWCCRIGVVWCLLAAFGIHASLPLAALLVVAGGASTMVPVPGGAGTQQVLAMFVLSSVASSSSALGYSIGAQLAITLVNTTIAVLASMLVFGRLHPLAALRQSLAAIRAPQPATTG